jgi:hypothetical protein
LSMGVLSGLLGSRENENQWHRRGAADNTGKRQA